MSLEYSVEGLGRLKRVGVPMGSTHGLARRTIWVRSVVLLLLAASGGPGLVAGLAQTPHAHKEHKRDYKREIEAVEGQWRTAQLAGDIGTLDKLMAEDYFGISLTGELNNKTQQLERVQKGMLVITKIDVSETKIKLLSGRVAIVTSLANIDAKNDGVPMSGSVRYTRVYKRYPDGSWKITNFEVTRVPDKG